MKKITLLSVVMSLLLLIACQEDTFMGDSEMVYQPPSDLKYMDVEGAREGKRIITFPPAVNTGKLIPYFEILSVKDSEGNELDETYMKDISIANPVVGKFVNTETGESNEIPVISYKDAGAITIAEGNKFTNGDYTFDIKVITSPEDATIKQEATFVNGFELKVGPALAEALIFSPLTQNLLTDASNQTTAPFMPVGNADVRFELGNHTDIFTINAETGVIKIKDGVTVQADTYYPQVKVISNISEEVASFEGQDFLVLIVSDTPVELEPQTITLFYPTMQAENTMYGYRKFVMKDGGLDDNKIWIQNAGCPLAADDRPESAAGAKSVMTNIVVGGQSLPHESWVVMNSQSLYNYSQGFDLSAIFWIKNQYVEYMADGRTPTDLEVYVSTDYASSVENATWEKVNAVVKSEINNSGNIIIGTPYPGDQKGDNPDGLKDPAANADAKWVKCILDLAPYKTATNFTLAFKFASYFDEAISGATGRGGRYYISDVHVQAKEVPQE